MSIATYLDIESMVKAWVSAGPVAPLVTRPGGGLNIFLAMPLGSPLPSVILSRVGGAPARRSTVPSDTARISFDCWAASRPQAIEIARVLVGEIDSLSQAGGYTAGSGRLEVGEVVSWLWLPDPESDTPRYVVDGLFTAVAS